MFGFFASIVVWFGWNLVIARIYKAEWDEYAVYGSIYDAFGSQLFWWAAVGLVLGTLVSIELMAQSLRRVLLPTDVDHFQELEKRGLIGQLAQDHDREEKAWGPGE
jgi:magnesium-transporting ATPase (P-type)